MKFIIDTQLPPKLSRFLKKMGYDSVHTTHYPEGHLLADKEIILIAKSEERTVVTKDSDFLDHFVLKGAPPKVLLVEFGNISNNDLITMFKQDIDNIVELFKEGNNLIVFKRDEILAFS